MYYIDLVDSCFLMLFLRLPPSGYPSALFSPSCTLGCPCSFSILPRDGFFVLFPPLVVSHSIFIREGLYIFPPPCLPLLPFSYFLSLYLLLHVKDCISNSKIHLEEQKISGEEVLLFWMVFIGCINWFFGM